jgi:L-seryl-tRNA(Ser) seleniumtransferase
MAQPVDVDATARLRLAQEYRKLPAVDGLLRIPAVNLLVAEHGVALVTATLRTLLTAARQAIAQGEAAPTPAQWPQRVAAVLAEVAQPSLRPVINATGIIIHTNLGRAPLSLDAQRAVLSAAQGYSNLEYDLAAGQRGSRYDHSRTLISRLTGAEDALVVNNNAAALVLVLSALCQGREVIISRGQLVEIGGGFRIPDVLRQSGVRLVEVGTTNRTHPHDFSDALTPDTAALLRVHSSNFRQIGFVSEPTLAELAQIAHAPDAPVPDAPVLLIDDLGSGTLLDTGRYGLAAEPMVQASVAAGADVVTFSGDKLLGGPQAGIIIGRAKWIAQIRRHPLARALRVDKLTLAALEATLRSYQRGAAVQEIPVWQMIAAPVDELARRVQQWQAALGADSRVAIWPGESATGGGSLPGETLPTHLLALALPHAEQVAAQLRGQALPIVCRIQQAHLLFDPRTVLPAQEEGLLAALRQILA